MIKSFKTSIKKYSNFELLLKFIKEIETDNSVKFNPGNVLLVNDTGKDIIKILFNIITQSNHSNISMLISHNDKEPTGDYPVNFRQFLTLLDDLDTSHKGFFIFTISQYIELMTKYYNEVTKSSPITIVITNKNDNQILLARGEKSLII